MRKTQHETSIVSCVLLGPVTIETINLFYILYLVKPILGYYMFKIKAEINTFLHIRKTEKIWRQEIFRFKRKGEQEMWP